MVSALLFKYIIVDKAQPQELISFPSVCRNKKSGFKLEIKFNWKQFSGSINQEALYLCELLSFVGKTSKLD